MSDAGSGSSGEEIRRPKINPWIIAVAVSLAAFMDVLDTSIANVALPHIVGLPAEKTNAPAGLMNFMRNIGQSVGTSAVTTLIARLSQYHQSVLAEYTGPAGFTLR